MGLSGTKDFRRRRAPEFATLAAMGKWLDLLRGFFPSWRFFDDLGAELVLEARVGASPETLGPWRNCLPPIRRSWRNLVINPEGNFLHACHNQLSHLNADIQASISPDQLDAKTSYVITRRLVEYQIRRQNLATPPYQFQFRLTARYEQEPGRPDDYVLVSPIQGNATDG